MSKLPPIIDIKDLKLDNYQAVKGLVHDLGCRSRIDLVVRLRLYTTRTQPGRTLGYAPQGNSNLPSTTFRFPCQRGYSFSVCGISS